MEQAAALQRAAAGFVVPLDSQVAITIMQHPGGGGALQGSSHIKYLWLPTMDGAHRLIVMGTCKLFNIALYSSKRPLTLAQYVSAERHH